MTLISDDAGGASCFYGQFSLSSSLPDFISSTVSDPDLLDFVQFTP